MSVSRRESKRLREAGLAMRLETGRTGDDGDGAEEAPLVKRRRSTRLEEMRLPAPAGVAVSRVEQQDASQSWDRLSFELRCRVLSCLNAADVARVALTSRRWNAAVALNLKVRTALSFSDGPRGIVPPGLSNAVLLSLLSRCPQLQRIYGLHFSGPLSRGASRCGVRRSMSSSRSSSTANVGDGGARKLLTVLGIIRALRQCRQLEGVEISDLLLLESVTEIFPNVRILYGFRNRHGSLPLEAAVLGEPCKVRLCADVLTTSIELYAVTLPSLPRMRHVRRLRLQYVQFSQPMPFDSGSLPQVESFVMKFCTVLPERDHNAFFVDLHAFQLDLPCYRPLLESLAAAPNLSNLELVALPIAGGSLQQMVMTRRAGGGCFTKLSHVALGNCPNVVEDDLGVLIVSSSAHLERLSVQQSLSRDSLLRALTVCGCVLPSLEHLHVGYSEQPPANLDLVEPRDRHRMPYDFDRYRTRSPCLLTDGGLTLVLASQLMPSLKSLAIADSPHLIDARTWTAPIRTKLTDLTLTRCHSLRLSDLEDAIEQMTALQNLTLEHMFREPPKGCWHVGLTAGTGLGASAGPFGMAVGRTSARTSAARHHSSTSSTSAVGRANGDSAGGSAAMTSASAADLRAAAATGGRQCTCVTERPPALSSPYRTSQVHAYTQVSNDELRSGSNARPSCSRQATATLGSNNRGGEESGAAGGVPAAAAQPCASTSSASADHRLRQQAVNPGSDASGCGLCPSCGGMRQALLRRPPDGPCSRHRQHHRHAWGTRRSTRTTSTTGDAARCPDCQRRRQGVTDAGSTSESGRTSRAAVAAPAAAAAAAATADSPASGRPRLASKATGTSDPLPQPYSENPFCLRSTSLVSLNLEDVGISSLVFESCPKLDTVTAFACRSLRHVAVGEKQLIGPLSRLTLNGCPRLDGPAVAHLMLCQPMPPPTEGASSGRLRVCSVEANWKVDKVQRAASFVDFVKYWLSCNHVTDRADAAYVVAEEAGPWTDVRRRVQLENSLFSLLTPLADHKRSDRLPNGRGAAADSCAKSADDGRCQAASLRLHRGRAEVAVARPRGVTDEDELSRDGLVEKPLRVRYLHNISLPCASCSRLIDPWIAHDCSARWRKACECKQPSTSVPLRHITCVYFYATAASGTDSL